MKLATDWDLGALVLPAESGEEPEKPREPRIKCYTPAELRAYVPDNDIVLVGDCHIMRGEIFVIGGEPGVGKSIAATDLAIAGAIKGNWFGLPTRSRFKTLIIQNENGRFRLRQEYEERGLKEEIEDWILVSEPPPYGMTLNDPEFLEDIKAILESFKPDVVIFDPWNSAAKDDKLSEYKKTFETLRTMLPIENKPALGIVAHTRKPQLNEKRTGGSGLMHLLAGSYILSSMPRSVFIMLRGTSDETDDSVVFVNPKNSNGQCASRTAWERSLAGFTQILDFDWENFEAAGETERKTIQIEHIKKALIPHSWKRSEAVKRLMSKSECGERACQKALSETGRFANHLLFEGEFVRFKE